jgi:hypothetical protein
VAVKPLTRLADPREMEASEYAFVHGVRCTKSALAVWRADPWPVLRPWLSAALLIAALLLAAVVAISYLLPASAGSASLSGPPFAAGGAGDVLHILKANGLVLALHAMACVAGFIAGSSLPLQAGQYTGRMRVVHERGPVLALGFVATATTFSLSLQAYTIGRGTARAAAALHASPVLLVVGLLPHALPELTALFLPLAAWTLASRRGGWDRLLAATLVTVALAIPTLVAAALWEVYLAPHLLTAMFGQHP